MDRTEPARVGPPPRRPEPGMVAKVTWAWRWFWFLLLRNRLAIAVASLLWLLYRSGTQPRRLNYPCQQVAAVNVGAFIAGLIPTLFLVRRKGLHAQPRSVVVRRQLTVAGIAFLTALVGIEGYQYAQRLTPPELPWAPARPNDATPTTVGIAQRDAQLGDTWTEADIEALVRRAITRAGGLEQVVNNGDTVIIKPNMVQPEWTATSGVITDPRVCAAIVKVAKEAGAAAVKIAEGTAATFSGGDRNVTWQAYQNQGYDTNGDHLFDYDPTVTLHDLNDAGGLDQADPDKVELVDVPLGVLRTQYYVPKLLLEPNTKLICVPNFKNHYNGTVTLSMKNRVGTAPNDIYHMPGWNTMKWALVHSVDEGFPGTVPPLVTNGENEIVQRTVVDLNLARPNDFAVVDGLIGITNGPNATPSEFPDPKMHRIVAGRDALAVDTVCTMGMGYKPDYVPHLAMANGTGALGTMDRSVITVVGDRVWKIRSDDFPAGYGVGDNGYGAAVLSDAAAPWFTDVSVDEDAQLISGDSVTISGIGDNEGVARSEVGVDLLGPDLVTNGGFETGTLAGWTTWRASWGANEVWDATSTEPGHLGNYCLRLGNSSTQSSFGVYQEVPVTPGKMYRLDCYWRGQKLGDANWFEVLLLDGPWDPIQADSGDAETEVEPNYMYAYDNNTYGLPGPIGTPFGWIWGHEQYAPPRYRVDWNDRRGRRIPSGNTLTIVLKAGACCGSSGVAAWFDAVTLTEVTSENVVGYEPRPGATSTVTLDLANVPLGNTPAELRVSVLDDAGNERSVARDVTVNSAPLDPWVCLDKNDIRRAVFVGDALADDAFEVTNCGPDTLNYDITVEMTDDGDWLGVFPLEGSRHESDPPATHTITYDTVSLPPGTYFGTITVTGQYNVQTIDVQLEVETVAPDFDTDGDVDCVDYAYLQRCYSGAGVPQVDPECTGCDLDGDDDCDQEDYAHFEPCLGGANIAPDPDCENVMLPE